MTPTITHEPEQLSWCSESLFIECSCGTKCYGKHRDEAETKFAQHLAEEQS